MSEVVMSVALVLVFAAHIVWFKWRTTSSWWFALAYVIVIDVSWMSHLWHILYGEDRIGTCTERHENDVFGWTPCFVSEWNTYVNTYEITLVVEFIVLTSLAYAVIPAFSTMTDASTTAQIVAYALNSVNFIFAIMLLFASPLFLDGFKDVFTVTGFICSLALAGVLEYVIYDQRDRRCLPMQYGAYNNGALS